ncbi:zinc finger protein 227 [Trichonephila clavipes]|nr:zinc finger protein 227 [Trichonephila clavipes]
MCNSSFSTSGGLKVHLSTHTNEKPYICEICGKSFSRATRLKAHLRIHTKEMPYVCKICNKGFSQNGSLRYHLSIHTKEKPYVCEMCNKGFTQAAFDRVWRKGQTRQGLPQGSVLSPVLFNIMINNLLSFIDNAVPEINSLLYADDLVLWSTGSDIPKLESTQNSALDRLRYLPQLDSRLTWTKHIAKVVENATSRLFLLKRIAGVKWGSSQSVLTSTFTSYIRPVIDYGSELLVTASDSALSKLDIVQNKALRFISGAATSTPIASIQLQTEISSSSERRQYSAPSLEFQKLANVFGVSDNRLPLFRPTIFPGHLRYASANLDLILPVHKHNSLLAELRSAALATIHERYPEQDWLHVFTDGSATVNAYPKFFHVI